MRDCTCVGSCRGAQGLGVGWNCVVDNGSVEDARIGAPSACIERPPSENTGALIRYGVLHRTEGELYSHAPMADGYWTPWHLAADEVARLEARVRFYEQHTDRQANELVEVTIQRDKWLAAFNRSEQFQDGPTKQRDRLRAALVGLVGVDTRAELEQLEAAMRLMPAPAQDKAATIDAIHALVATLPEPAQDAPETTNGR